VAVESIAGVGEAGHRHWLCHHYCLCQCHPFGWLCCWWCRFIVIVVSGSQLIGVPRGTAVVECLWVKVDNLHQGDC